MSRSFCSVYSLIISEAFIKWWLCGPDAVRVCEEYKTCHVSLCLWHLVEEHKTEIMEQCETDSKANTDTQEQGVFLGEVGIQNKRAPQS